MKPFGVSNKPSVNPSVDHKARVLRALERHAQRAVDTDVNYTARKTVKEEEKPKAKRADHNARTKDYYISKGYIYSREDHFDRTLNRAHDFLGFADGVAMKPGDCRAVQLTSKSSISARVNKILESKLAKAWVTSGCHIDVIGWEKDSQGRYQPTVRTLTLDQF